MADENNTPKESVKGYTSTIRALNAQIRETNKKKKFTKGDERKSIEREVLSLKVKREEAENKRKALRQQLLEKRMTRKEGVSEKNGDGPTKKKRRVEKVEEVVSTEPPTTPPLKRTASVAPAAPTKIRPRVSKHTSQPASHTNTRSLFTFF